MIPAFLDKYIGLSFNKYNCWQLMCLIYKKEFNINLPTFFNEYENALDKEKIKDIYTREMSKRFKQIDKPKKYCFIVLRMGGQPWHCGMVIDEKYMIHTDRKVNSVIENYKSKLWKPRTIGFYEYAGTS